MTTLGPTQQSLQRAAQTLQTAADAAETDTRSDPSRYLTALGVHTLLWLCGSLLPDGLPILPDTVGSRSVGAILRSAEAELRSFPIQRYPAGTLHLVVGLCDLIRETNRGPA